MPSASVHLASPSARVYMLYKKMSKFLGNGLPGETFMSTMILAAGQGRRLAPLTTLHPKPLVPFGLSSALAQLMDQLARARAAAPALVWRAGGPVLNAHHLGAQCVAFAHAHGLGVSLESELLGTAGGVQAAAGQLGAGPTLVWNADILTDVDPNAVRVAFAEAPCFALLAVVPAPAGEGNVGMAADGRIVRLRQTIFSAEVSGGYFMGIQVLSSVAKAHLPLAGCLVSDLYLPALAKGVVLRAWQAPCTFVDLGTLGEYWAANLALAQRAGGSLIAADAEVPGEVSDSVVGAGARVHARVRRSVIWPGVCVQSALEDAIATPAGVLRSPFSQPAFAAV